MTLQVTLETLFVLARRVTSACVASVIVPARNEQATIRMALESLARQVDLKGKPLDADTYQVLLLVNNCTDRTAEVSHAFARQNPHFNLHVIVSTLAAEIAHVGTARGLLMDLACARLEENGQINPSALAILSTDADSIAAPDWIVQNLAAIEKGAEVVGGVINLMPQDLADLEPGTRLAFERDAELNSILT